MTTLITTDIEERIPHRYENLLLDECTVADDRSEFNVQLNDEDPQGRHIFLTNHLNSRALPTPILAEIAALACIVSAGKIKPGTFAYFAAITNFKIENGPIDGHAKLTGTTEKMSGKNGFYKYRFSMSHSEQQATGQLMAFYDTTGESGGDTEPIALDPALMATLSLGTPIAPNASKAHDMTFVDAIHHHSESNAIYGYSYPKHHPLVKGHFPGNPVMMGVCQWLMLEDAMAHYLSEYHHKDRQSITCNAQLFKSDHTKVCEIKSATLVGQYHNGKWHIHTSAVKKVMFKQRVQPNDQLYIYISDIQLG
tara:strand:- start:1323 stop:2249 length:927 start_codon:yes stop_codon:yes gene_type:complete